MADWKGEAVECLGRHTHGVASGVDCMLGLVRREERRLLVVLVIVARRR